MSIFKIINICLLLILISFPCLSWGHGEKKHDDKEDVKVVETISTPSFEILLTNINEQYTQKIKPIFQKKCFDCHSDFTVFPWYVKIPGPKHLMEYDIRQALKHMDMSKDFPFGGHGSPLEDLEELKKTITENDMPPLRYILLHWDSRINDDEKRVILD